MAPKHHLLKLLGVTLLASLSRLALADRDPSLYHLTFTDENENVVGGIDCHASGDGCIHAPPGHNLSRIIITNTGAGPRSDGKNNWCWLVYEDLIRDPLPGTTCPPETHRGVVNYAVPAGNLTGNWSVPDSIGTPDYGGDPENAGPRALQVCIAVDTPEDCINFHYPH